MKKEIKKMKYIISLFFIFAFLSVSYSAITIDDAKKMAEETLAVLKEINTVLDTVKKKENITEIVKTRLSIEVNKLKILQNKIELLKRNATPDDIRNLNSQFNAGPYAVALKKEVNDFFYNIQRVKSLPGGTEIAVLFEF